MAMLTVSDRELSRIDILQRIVDHGLTCIAAAPLLGLSQRQVHRLVSAYRAQGASALVSKRRGKPSNRGYPATFRNKVIELVREHYPNCGATVVAKKLAEHHGVRVSHETVRRWMIGGDLWMADLCGILREKGQPVSAEVERKITRAAGYRWRKARVVLTSNDPAYSDKIGRIRTILSSLGPDEAFFSIDEYGPFAVKAKPGLTLTAPGEQRTVPQWQKSRGCLLMTAALELSGNQVTHFYSARKNTAEMIRMMEVLVDRYSDRKKLYLSWDRASWHISKRLLKRIEEHNAAVQSDQGPIVETAPLPTGAQFLNVIESVFSGMARAIIHNSDYKSVDNAKTAIDRYLEERNAHFRQHARRAGDKIWRMEREPTAFSEANNCKDPRYR